MRYVSAYMLAMMGSKHHHITVNDIENILGSVGVDCEHNKTEEIIMKMQGKTLDELITEGSKYLSSLSPTLPSIGGTLATVAASSADVEDNIINSPTEKEEKKEKEEESDEDMGFGLFD